MEMNYANIIG